MISIDKQNFKDRKALIRVDFNVPLSPDNKVMDPSRIQGAKSTILKVIRDGGSCVLISHLGRPKGNQKKFSLKPTVPEIEKILNMKVFFSEDALGLKTKKTIKGLKPGQVLLLENIRFYSEEEKGDESFAKELSSYGDCYINDAFGSAHRAHASTTTLAKFFGNNKFSGHLLSKEIESVKKVLSSGKKPVLAILGGAKVSSKITIIKSMMDKVDEIIIGGGMAFTFVKALGGEIGNSICENDMLDLALSILQSAKLKQIKIHLPLDVVCSQNFSNEGIKKVEEINNISKGWQGLDAGPMSITKFQKVIKKANTILWNGPVGVFELDSFSKGTIEIGKAIASRTREGAFSLVGGGDSVAAVKKFNFQDKVSFVSTGGGAMLESLEGKPLPGILALSN